MIASLRFQIGLFAVLQALLLTNNVTLIAINGLAGFQLAEDKTWATLPVTGYILGGAVWAMPAARIMRRHGRRVGYGIGSLVAVLASALGWAAMQAASLPLLCTATFIGGLYNAFGVSYRFAAADAADHYRPTFRARAISLVLAGGVIGGVVGPELAKWSRGVMPVAFAGTYLTLIGFAILSFLLAQLIRLPNRPVSASDGPARPLSTILAQPACWVAIVANALSYGVMNLLMVVTPLAMEACRHPFESAALVLEWHVIGMYAPGFVTGSLIGRIGVLPVIALGCVLMFGCVAVALSGVDLMQFLASLFLLGVGWNFMYTGGTTLLTRTCGPAEKNRVQGFADACTFATMIVTSASSAALLFSNGWALLNLLSVPFVAIVLVATIWLAGREGWGVGRLVSPQATVR